jgi:hypothetical protein|tara:strand:- start:719 stop:1147 length:429 start_codon:yes stop_codon:yes gene_type:complete
MSFDKTLAEELEDIVISGLAEIPLPYQKGNSIRLKNVVIRKHKNGYRVFNISTNKHITTTFTKTAAVAIAKLYAHKQEDKVDSITDLDTRVSKHYMDALFAKRTVESSKDSIRRESAETKFEIALDRAWSSLAQIESYIFDK